MKEKSIINKLKKIDIMQYVALTIPAIPLVFSFGWVVSFMQFAKSEVGAILQIFGFCLVGLMPLGAFIVPGSSTMAFVLKKRNKRKVAHIYDRFCINFFIFSALMSLIMKMMPIAIILWSIVALNFFLNNKAKELQKILEAQELVGQNNDED